MTSSTKHTARLWNTAWSIQISINQIPYNYNLLYGFTEPREFTAVIMHIVPRAMRRLRGIQWSVFALVLSARTVASLAGEVGTQPQVAVASQAASGQSASDEADDVELLRIDDHAKRSDALHAIVDAWLKPSDGGELRGLGANAASLPLTDAELSFMSKLKPCELPVYNPRTGCVAHAAYSLNCFPSQKVIPNMIKFHPGEVVLDYGSFLGEATFALDSAINQVQAKYGNLSGTHLLAMDTWKEHRAYGGLWTTPSKWQPPSSKETVGIDIKAPPPYYQFLTNIRRRPTLAERVIPISMLTVDTTALGNALGLSTQRPKLIYVNPPRHPASLSRDLPELWRLLACGGTIGGAGYHVSRSEIDSFATSIPGAKLEAYMVHAPGSNHYERNFPFYAAALGVITGQFHANFTHWKIQNKSCDS